MTLDDLHQWRKRVPFFIAAFCVLPWFIVRSRSFSEAESAVRLLVPTLALAFAFFYVSSKLRAPHWNREMDRYVRAQIREALIALIPQDLEVSQEERDQLAQSEIYKELTGVFWEAVDQSPILRAHKEHFYSNGIEYSTAIDGYQICAFFGFCYAVASVALADVVLSYLATVLVVIALLCRFWAIPRTRERHLALSREQLDLLRRERGNFVAERFREIVLGWRRARLLR